MLRLAVSIKKPSFTHITFIKSLQFAFKHTDSRGTYLRSLSNDASSLRIDNENPIKEVFSLEDFGLLSIAKSPSIETSSSFENESTFIDQLLKNDSFSNFSSIHIPTTIDSKELGGKNEEFGYDHAAELLSEGVDAEIVAEELNDIPTIYYHDDQVPSTSKTADEDDFNMPFLIPSDFRESKTRKLLSERVRRERELNFSTATISEYQNIGEMMFPDSIEEEKFVSNWKDTPRIITEKTVGAEDIHENSDLEFSLEVLEGMITEETSVELIQELQNIEWPEYVFTEGKIILNRANSVLRFAISNSCDADTAERIIKRFLDSHILATVADDILIKIISKFAKSSNSDVVISKMRNVMEMCIKREMRPNFLFMKKALEELYTLMLEKDLKSAHLIFSECCRLNLDKSPELFMKCHAKYVSNKSDFFVGFNDWKKLSCKYGRTCGIESFWMVALAGSGREQAKKMDAMFTHCNKTDHPFSTIANIINTFIKLNEMDKALEVFKMVSISGRHFKGPLVEFVEKCDLECIERLASIVEEGIIAERRRNSNNKDTKQVQKNFDAPFYTTLTKFYGIGGTGRKKNFVDKKMKRKIHRVDEEQLHELCETLQKAWIRCAEELDDSQSAKRLFEWCLRNRVEIDDKLSKRINIFK